MRIFNIHDRTINTNIDQLIPLFDSFLSSNDKIWPYEKWPPVKFDGKLCIGAVGEHGPIRYCIKRYRTGRTIRFEFPAPSGFDGHHIFELEEIERHKTVIRHIIDMDITGQALVTWELIFYPLHDALMEDVLDKVENNFVNKPKSSHWSIWVRFLRWMLKIKGVISNVQENSVYVASGQRRLKGRKKQARSFYQIDLSSL